MVGLQELHPRFRSPNGIRTVCGYRGNAATGGRRLCPCLRLWG